MKTMWKKKLVNAGLLSIAFFVIVTAVRANISRQPGDSTVRKTATDTIQLLSFNPYLLKIKGTMDSSATAAMSIHLNKQVSGFVKKYIKENSSLLTKIRDKHPTYFSIIDSVFIKYGIPTELKYLAIIESKLKVTAVSPAGAVGAWQMMPVTAKLYSLRITSKYDERRHFYKSTVAAAKMLKDLHGQFDDWLLVIAAYNSGPGGVYKAIKRSGSRNFWKLQSFLPAETRAHVKRFIGTHYYYEQTGSIVTLTKDEVVSQRKKMMEYVEKQNSLLKTAGSLNPVLDTEPKKKEEKAITGISGELNLIKE